MILARLWRYPVAQPGGGAFGAFVPPTEIFETWYNNFYLYGNFHRMEMKFYIPFMKISYSNSVTFQKFSVCVVDPRGQGPHTFWGCKCFF